MGNSVAVHQQIALMPIKALWCSPASLGSADLKQVCKCEDGSQYAIKETEVDPRDASKSIWTAHNEHFCYRLGQMVGIASPNHHIVELSADRLAFGSRWEGGTQPNFWWDQIAAGTIARDDILPTLARVYVFDLFIHNTDRHTGNLLIRQQHIGHAAIAFDYSRAWTFHGFPLPSLPFAAGENTVKVQRGLSSLLGSYVTEAIGDEILHKLNHVSVDNIRDILNSQPESWLTNSARQDIISWWASPGRIARIDAIKAGIKNGSFL